MKKLFSDTNCIDFNLREDTANGSSNVEVDVARGMVAVALYSYEHEIGDDADEVIWLTAAEARKLQKALKKARKHLHRENN